MARRQRASFPRRYQTRCEEGDARQEARDARSPREQLAALNQRLGIGVGAKRERARLQALIDAN